MSSLCHCDGSPESHAEEEDYTSVNYLLFSEMQADRELTKQARSMMSSHSLLDTAGVICTRVYNFTVMEMAFTPLSGGMRGKDAERGRKKIQKST